METIHTHTTYLTVTQRDTTTELSPLPTGQVTVLTAQGGLPGPKGDDGDQGPPGQDGAAQIPEIMDGGNF
jgi:hypothetical protein